MIYLTAEELLSIARRVVGDVVLRDAGLLDSAAARPATRFGGEEVYSELITKCAALLHSLARNRALMDGNKRLALAGSIVFLGINGMRMTASNDEAYELIVAVAAGDLDDVPAIAARLAVLVEPW